MKAEKLEFGKELGLVHEAVVTGRKAGAGERFWATLAHDDAVFQQVVHFVAESQKPSKLDKQLVERWLAVMAVDWPCCEQESYYSRSSHCGYGKSMRTLSRKFSALFLHAQHNEESRVLAAAVECHFILCYIYSGAHAARYYRERKWFHPPLVCLYHTFDDLVEGELLVTSRGQFLSHEHFLANESVRSVRDIASKYHRQWVDNGYLHGREIHEVHQVCDKARKDQEDRILHLLSTM